MKKLELRPYPGTIKLCKSRKEFYKEHEKLFGDRGVDLTDKRGRMAGKWDDKIMWPIYLVWGEAPPQVAHELSHVILHVFELAGIDPREAAGEPFCYMLSQLLLDAE